MATGLAVPLRASPSGGLLKASGEDHDNDIIRSALGSDDNDNAFSQNLGLGEEAIFGINDAELRATLLVRLRAIFARFEAQKRFRLMEDTIDWKTVPGEQILFFKYVNLETDKEQDFRQNLSGLGAAK